MPSPELQPQIDAARAYEALHVPALFGDWAAPVLDGYAREVLAALRAAGLRAEADLRNEKINYKVREHSLAKVPVILALGGREMADRTVSLRRLGEKESTVEGLESVVAALAAEATPPDLR